MRKINARDPRDRGAYQNMNNFQYATQHFYLTDFIVKVVKTDVTGLQDSGIRSRDSRDPMISKTNLQHSALPMTVETS